MATLNSIVGFRKSHHQCIYSPETENLILGFTFRLFLESEYNYLQMHHTVDSYKWKLIPSQRLMAPINEFDFAKHPADDYSTVYRLIWAVRHIVGEIDKEFKAVQENLDELERYCKGYESAVYFSSEIVSQNDRISFARFSWSWLLF